MKKIIYTQAEADEILFSAMKDELSTMKDELSTMKAEQHIERTKIKINDLNSFKGVVELFIHSDIDNIMLETNSKIFKQYIELVQSEGGPLFEKNMKVILNVADRFGKKILIYIHKEDKDYVE